jgi:CTP-dependent riboflavin kinase
MKTYQIDILNPKAARLLQDLADLKLISIKETKKQDFMKIVSKFRKKVSSNVPTLEEITKEVENVRFERNVKNKR